MNFLFTAIPIWFKCQHNLDVRVPSISYCQWGIPAKCNPMIRFCPFYLLYLRKFVQECTWLPVNMWMRANNIMTLMFMLWQVNYSCSCQETEHSCSNRPSVDSQQSFHWVFWTSSNSDCSHFQSFWNSKNWFIMLFDSYM